MTRTSRIALSAFLAATALSAYIHKEERFSDHAPLVVAYGFSL